MVFWLLNYHLLIAEVLLITFDPEIGMVRFLTEKLNELDVEYEENLSWEENYKILLRLQRKIPSTEPRRVIELPGIYVPDDLVIGYRGVLAKIENGDSIEGHLSFSSKKITYDDNLLDFLGIHHFHLKLSKHKKGGFKRSGPIAFAMFFSDAVVIIDVINHTRKPPEFWSMISLIERLHKYLPETIVGYKVSFQVNERLSDVEISNLRANGINHAIKLEDGTSYMFPFMMSGKMHSTEFPIIRNVKKKIKKIEGILSQSESEILRALNLDEARITVCIDGDDIKPFIEGINKVLELK